MLQQLNCALFSGYVKTFSVAFSLIILVSVSVETGSGALTLFSGTVYVPHSLDSCVNIFYVLLVPLPFLCFLKGRVRSLISKLDVLVVQYLFQCLLLRLLVNLEVRMGLCLLYFTLPIYRIVPWFPLWIPSSRSLSLFSVLFILCCLNLFEIFTCQLEEFLCFLFLAWDSSRCGLTYDLDVHVIFPF